MTNIIQQKAEDTFEFWVSEASKGRNIAECWQNIYRIHESTAHAVREELTDKAWEYCVKAVREESGSKEDLKAHLTDTGV